MTTHLRISAAVGLLWGTFISGTIEAQVVERRDALGRQVEQRCQPMEWPKRLPALVDVLDSAALSAALDTLFNSDTTSIVVSILYQKDATATLHLVTPDALPPAVGVSLLKAVTASLRPLKPPQSFGAVRVQWLGGLRAPVTVARAVYCPPAPAPGGPAGPRTATVTLRPGDHLPTPGQRMRLDAEVSLDEAGNVTDVRLIAPSGVHEVDDFFVQEQWQRLYLPALIDGVPIMSWLRTSGSRMRL